MKIGFIGLGRMGSRMVKKLLSEGHEVIVWNRSSEVVKKFKVEVQNLKIAETIENLVQQLESPRIVWLMLPAGEATKSILENLMSLVEKEDIVIDGGNAHFRDTEERCEEFKTVGVRFLGIGVSGGILAEKNGYPLMAGGDISAYQYITPILDSLSKPNGGHEYFGTGGAGHFVKMVHNGMEYGIMQSLAEGFGVLQKSGYKFDLLKIAKLYQKGTLVSGFMLDRVTDVLSGPSILSIDGHIEASGEAKWTIDEAEKEGVPTPVIKESLRFRTLSQVDEAVRESFAAKLVASLRNVFGGHEVKKK